MVANVDGRRWPILTLVVFVVTGAVNISQLTFAPHLLTDLQRTPAGLHGDWWRTITSLLVQDGGVAGATGNLLGLLILGIAAEQVGTARRWILGYLGAGLVGEFIGYAWQSTGGGNSVAVCGLAAIVLVAYVRRARQLPRFAAPAVTLWLGFLLATWIFPLIGVGVVASVLSQNDRLRDNVRFQQTVVAVAILVGAVLCAVRNIHGAALLAGLVLAAIPAGVTTSEQPALS